MDPGATSDKNQVTASAVDCEDSEKQSPLHDQKLSPTGAPLVPQPSDDPNDPLVSPNS